MTYTLPLIYKALKLRLRFKKRMFIGSGILFISTVLIGTLIISIIEKYESKNNGIDIAAKINELNIKADLEILKEKELKEKKILAVIQEYFIANHSENIERLDTFYSFPVVKFYRLLNVSKEKLNYWTRFEWRRNSAKTYFIINNTNTSIRYKGSDTILVTIKQHETENSTIFLNIKLNKDLKIFSIGNSILTNYYGNDNLDSTIKKPK
ncbi:MAG: hypothetical protein MUC81_10340 [Bacteroidia bacterium]|nr:hypothetical protein [Bacteroidia bacterium]